MVKFPVEDEHVRQTKEFYLALSEEMEKLRIKRREQSCLSKETPEEVLDCLLESIDNMEDNKDEA